MIVTSKSLNIQTVQLSYEKPNISNINPKVLTLGRNYNYTNFQRAYVRCDLTQLKGIKALKSAELRIPVLETLPEETELVIFWATSDITSLRDVNWQNINKIKLNSIIASSLVYKNTFIAIDLRAIINYELLMGTENLELMLISNENKASSVTFRNDTLNSRGMLLNIEFNDESQIFDESVMKINTTERVAYTENIDYFKYSVCSVFVTNKGISPINVIVENSCDRMDYVEGSDEVALEEGKCAIVVPYYFSKYMRIKITTKGTEINSVITVQGNLV